MAASTFVFVFIGVSVVTTKVMNTLLLLPDERYHLITAFDKFLHFLCRTFMFNRVDAVLLEVFQRTGKEVFL